MPKIIYYRLLNIAGLICVLDQVTKVLIQYSIPFESSYFPPDRVTIIENFFYLVHIGNEGAAWGMFSEYSGILTLLSFAVLFFIYYFRKQLELQRGSVQIAFGLLIGGILGNLIDRIRVGHVIDFIDIHLPFTLPYILPYGRWPAFNIADSAIVIGMLFYLLLSLSDTKKKIH
ncbi:MAG: signal peptidase II [Verrucomicrobia bacterium]|nr:signal peptidase II [Verrucomicrobiota bacterium]